MIENHLKLIKYSVELWNTVYAAVYPKIKANLRFADLRGNDLSYAYLRDADLEGANLRGVNLRGADLQGAILSNTKLENTILCDADLRDVDLRKVDLQNTDLRYKIEKFEHWFGRWPVIYTAGRIQIGCVIHSIDEWESFTDAEISGMDPKALDWWNKHKNYVINNSID